jgi:hypothetical protein
MRTCQAIGCSVSGMGAIGGTVHQTPSRGLLLNSLLQDFSYATRSLANK